MKKVTISIIIFLFVSSLVSQDKIYKLDETVIEATKIEIEGNTIKYKKYSNQGGATYSIKSSEVEKIVYANGEIESINKKTTYGTNIVNNAMYADFGFGLASLVNTPEENDARPLLVFKFDREIKGCMTGIQLGYRDIGATMLNIAPRFGYAHHISKKSSIYGGGMLGLAFVFGGGNTETTLNPGLFFGLNASLSDNIGFRVEMQNQFGDGKAAQFGTNITDVIYSLCIKF